jgi:4-hydroxymandelate oxidase
MDSADLDALEAAARAVISPAAYAFAAGGADDELTIADNIAAWQSLRLRPRVLRDVTAVDASVSVLGTRLPHPLMVAPMGRHHLYHAQAERETARGAAACDAIFMMATSSTVRIEDVATERRTAPQWFQLYMSDRSVAEAVVDRSAAAGFGALVFTVDQPVGGSNPRARRDPVGATPDIRLVNVPGEPIARNAYDPANRNVVRFPTTWKDLEWMVRRSPLPVVVKGILRADDALRCIDAGAKAVIVSNHGGRHLDTTVTSVAALPEVAAALAGKGEIYVDSGIRRGTDIVKALALGARAVLIGRPVLWGLSTGGADGVREVIDHLRTELLRSMALCGAASIEECTADLVVR